MLPVPAAVTTADRRETTRVAHLKLMAANIFCLVNSADYYLIKLCLLL